MKNNQLITTNEQTQLLLNQEASALSLRNAVYESARFAIPFALSRVAIALQNFGNGIVIQKLNIPTVIAAAPIMFMIQQNAIGAARGALSSVNAIVGNLNGHEKFEKIGPAINQGLVLGALLGIPTTILFSTSRHWLSLLGIDQELVRHVSEYLQALSYGIVPMYWSVMDQQFLLSIKRKYSPIVLNTLMVFASMAIGFPLSLSKTNTAFLGYGISMASIITFLSGRYYLYKHKVNGVLDREKYHLFSLNFNSDTSFCELFGLSFPTALQAISEWLPTMLIAILTSNSKDTLEAEAPSMQMLLVLIQILLGLGTASTVSVANALGKARTFYEQGQHDNEILWKKNARMIGFAELIVTTAVTLPAALFCIVYPDILVKLFSNNPNVTSLANNMLRVTGATLILDGIRNTTTGLLLGKKQRVDNFFTSITNLMITSAAAIALGYFTQKEMGPLSFFLFRMLGILISASLLLYRWNQGSKIQTSFNFFSEPVGLTQAATYGVSMTNIEAAPTH